MLTVTLIIGWALFLGILVVVTSHWNERRNAGLVGRPAWTLLGLRYSLMAASTRDATHTTHNDNTENNKPHTPHHTHHTAHTLLFADQHVQVCLLSLFFVKWFLDDYEAHPLLTLVSTVQRNTHTTTRLWTT